MQAIILGDLRVWFIVGLTAMVSLLFKLVKALDNDFIFRGLTFEY